MRKAVVAVVVALGPAGLSGCSGGTPAPHISSGGTSIEAASAAARTEFGLLAAGDYPGAWQQWTPAAQQAVDQAAFVRYFTTCEQPLGVAAQVTSVRQVDPGDVDISWQYGSARSGTVRMVYTGGRWRFQPDQATLDRYAKGACPSS
jgi:hypothetical protein